MIELRLTNNASIYLWHMNARGDHEYDHLIEVVGLFSRPSIDYPYLLAKFSYPLGRRAPQPNFQKFDPDIFPEVVTFYELFGTIESHPLYIP